jgi:hypothetical protein
MYGTSAISALFQKEFLDSKSLQNRIENQIRNSKLKTENRKENKTEKNRRRSLPGRSPPNRPINQSTRSPGSVPFRWVTDWRDPLDSGHRLRFPFFFSGLDDTPPATPRRHRHHDLLADICWSPRNRSYPLRLLTRWSKWFAPSSSVNAATASRPSPVRRWR